MMLNSSSHLPHFTRALRAHLFGFTCILGTGIMPAYGQQVQAANEGSWFSSFQEMFQPDATTRSLEEAGITFQTGVEELSPKALKEGAQDALDRGNYGLAKQLYTQLVARGELDEGQYGLALVSSQMGDYQDAYDLLNTLSSRGSGSRQAALEMRNRIVLTLAEEAQMLANPQDAEKWLRSFVGNNATRQEKSRFNRLVKTQNRLTSTDPLALEDGAKGLRVALLLPLSGNLAPVGQDMLRGAQMALFDASPKEILLYPIDTRGTPEGAQAAADKALRDGSDLVLGPLLSANMKAVRRMTQARNVPLIGFSSDESAAGDDTYLLSFLPQEQARLMATHATATSVTTAAILAPDTDYGRLMATTFKDELTRQGGAVMHEEYFDPTATDHSVPMGRLVQLEKSRHLMAAERRVLEAEYNLVGEAMDDASLTRLKNLKTAAPEAIIDFDGIFIPASAEHMPLIASQLAFYDVEPSSTRFLGTAQWHSPALLQNRAEYLRGAHFPAPDDDRTQAFNTAFERAYNQTPHPLAPLAYDSVCLVSQLLFDYPDSQFALQKALTRDEGFSGVSGPYRFRRRGLTERMYDILSVQSRGFSPVHEAPAAMPPSLPSSLSPTKRTPTPLSNDDDWWY